MKSKLTIYTECSNFVSLIPQKVKDLITNVSRFLYPTNMSKEFDVYNLIIIRLKQMFKREINISSEIGCKLKRLEIISKIL